MPASHGRGGGRRRLGKLRGVCAGARTGCIEKRTHRTFSTAQRRQHVPAAAEVAPAREALVLAGKGRIGGGRTERARSSWDGTDAILVAVASGSCAAQPLGTHSDPTGKVSPSGYPARSCGNSHQRRRSNSCRARTICSNARTRIGRWRSRDPDRSGCRTPGSTSRSRPGRWCPDKCWPRRAAPSPCKRGSDHRKRGRRARHKPPRSCPCRLPPRRTIVRGR